jgi:hypothetical protein
LTQGEFLASLAPGDHKNTVEILKVQDLAPTSTSQLWRLGKKKQATQSNFGQTQTERAPYFRTGSPRVRIAAAASVLTLLGLLGLALSSRAPELAPELPVAAAAPGVEAPTESPTPATPLTAPVALAAPKEQAAAPAVPIETSTPASVARAPELGSAPAQASDAVTSPASFQPARALGSGSAKKVLRTGTSQPARARSAKTAKTYTGDFKAKFGSRK